MNVLILLLGGNPLPNYVVTDYLLNPERDDENNLPIPSKIIFVSTKRSEKFYTPIRSLLREKHPENGCDFLMKRLEENHRDPEFIQNTIKSVLNGLKKEEDISSIHLNYSGGTKPMAVNGFIAVEEFSKKNGNKLILSDLDPEDFKLKVLNGNSSEDAVYYPSSGDLRNIVKLNIGQILELHGMDIPKNRKIGKQLIFDEDILDVDAFVKEVVPLYKKRMAHKTFVEFQNKLKQGEYPKKIFENYHSISEIYKPGIDTQKFTKKLNKFFNGGWLEDYVYKTLLDLKKKKKIVFDEICKGVYVYYEGRPLEIDVIVMMGYQMYLVSCTTSQKIKLVKHKAFEALYRAEQLGGLQAKVFVVSTMFNRSNRHQSTKRSNIEELKKDLKQFEAEDKCRLAGLDELSLEKESDGSLARMFESEII